MKLLFLILVLLIIAGCGGGSGINTITQIPELDNTEFNDSYYVAGWKNLKEGKTREAIKNFQLSTSKDEKLYVGFAYSFLINNKLKLAKRNFEKALEINPANIQARLGIATMYEILKENRRAFAIYAKLANEFPDNFWIKTRYEYIKTTQTENSIRKANEYLAKRNNAEYIFQLEDAEYFSPEIMDIKIKIADFYLEREDYQRSASYYKKALDMNRNNQQLLTKLGIVYEKMGRFDSAIIIYKKILELKPGDLDTINKISDLKENFFEADFPEQYKNIFFKETLNREDVAFLIGFYLKDYIVQKGMPVIITDIQGSFAKEQIIKLCSLKIMKVRPDHSFDRFNGMDRASFAVILKALLEYLENEGFSLAYSVSEHIIGPTDISLLHKHYSKIEFLVNSQIMTLDNDNMFNPTTMVTPTEALYSIKKILHNIEIFE